MIKINKEIFGERLKQLMSNFKETTYSLGSRFNLSPPTISRYTRGQMAPKLTTVNELANYFNVNPAWLAGESASIYTTEVLDELDTGSMITVPLYKTIQYDKPLFSNEKSNEVLKIPQKQIDRFGATIGYLMPDNSMSPTIEKGDRILIKLNTQLKEGNLIALFVNQSDMLIRKVVLQGNLIVLQPNNLDYNATVYRKSQTEIQVVGEVVYKEHLTETYFEE